MLNIRNITFAYFAILWALLNFTSLHYSFYIIATVLYLIIPVTASLSICSNLYLKAICKWKTDHDKVVLSFNLPVETNKINGFLEILEKQNIQALVFCTGELLDKKENLVGRLAGSGQTIGNFSWTVSRRFGFLSPKSLINEIASTEELIYKSDDETFKYFRPPYGVTNPSVKKATQIMNYIVIGWNVRMKLNNMISDQVIDSKVSGIKKGSIIRIDVTDDLEIDRLKRFIAKLTEKFSIVSIDEVVDHINMKK